MTIVGTQAPPSRDIFLIYGDSPHWTMRLFKKNFRHLAAAVCFDYLKHEDPVSRVVFLEYRRNALGIKLETLNIEDMYDGLPPSYRIQHVKVNPEFEIPDKYSIIAPFTCVEMTKRLLGIKKWNIFTPYQLFKYIQKGKFEFNNIR